MTKSESDRIARALLDWFSRAARDLPWRRTRDPYAIWVSEIMLQQTQVKTVIAYWERWMRNLPTIQALAEAAPERIHKLWEGLGYYTRVRNLQKAAQHIVACHGGRFPRDYDAILELPGIGRYTAGAIASIAFNQPRPVVDGNVMRVLTRLFGIEENPREKATNARLWRLSEELVNAAAQLCPDKKGPRTKITTRASTIGSDERCSYLNQALMELGALVCTPKQPRCMICPVRLQCAAERTEKTSVLPNLGLRAAATSRCFAAFVLERSGRFLVRQRPAGVVNAHLWEFPNIELAGRAAGSGLARAARKVLGPGIKLTEKLCVIKHSITRYRITVEAFLAAATKTAEPPDFAGEWRTLSQLRRLAFPSAHGRILRHLAIARAWTQEIIKYNSGSID
jgi:A/G-specific adenine glycosylase